LKRPDMVLRVATVAAPLNRSSYSKNAKLNHGLARLSMGLVDANPSLLRRIGSFRGRKDAVVSPQASMLRGAYNVELPTSGHAPTIALATTIYSGRLARWLKDGE